MDSCAYEDGEVGAEEVGEEHGGHDDGEAHEGADGQEVVALRPDVEGGAVAAAEAAHQEAGQHQGLSNYDLIKCLVSTIRVTYDLDDLEESGGGPQDHGVQGEAHSLKMLETSLF